MSDFCIVHEGMRIHPDLEICRNHLHDDDRCYYPPPCPHVKVEPFFIGSAEGMCAACGTLFVGLEWDY